MGARIPPPRAGPASRRAFVAVVLGLEAALVSSCVAGLGEPVSRRCGGRSGPTGGGAVLHLRPGPRPGERPRRRLGRWARCAGGRSPGRWCSRGPRSASWPGRPSPVARQAGAPSSGGPPAIRRVWRPSTSWPAGCSGALVCPRRSAPPPAPGSRASASVLEPASWCSRRSSRAWGGPSRRTPWASASCRRPPRCSSGSGCSCRRREPHHDLLEALVGQGAGLTAAVGVFVVVGNASSGGSCPRVLVAGPWRVVGLSLPNGAGLDALGSVGSLGGHELAQLVARPRRLRSRRRDRPSRYLARWWVACLGDHPGPASGHGPPGEAGRRG